MATRQRPTKPQAQQSMDATDSHRPIGDVFVPLNDGGGNTGTFDFPNIACRLTGPRNGHGGFAANSIARLVSDLEQNNVIGHSGKSFDAGLTAAQKDHNVVRCRKRTRVMERKPGTPCPTGMRCTADTSVRVARKGLSGNDKSLRKRAASQSGGRRGSRAKRHKRSFATFKTPLGLELESTMDPLPMRMIFPTMCTTKHNIPLSAPLISIDQIARSIVTVRGKTMSAAATRVLRLGVKAMLGQVLRHMRASKMAACATLPPGAEETDDPRAMLHLEARLCRGPSTLSRPVFKRRACTPRSPQHTTRADAYAALPLLGNNLLHHLQRSVYMFMAGIEHTRPKKTL